MSRFPLRPTRSTFGPAPVDRRPVKSPSRELGAEVMGSIRDHLAGVSAVSPLAWGTVDTTSGSAELVDAGEAWDPDALFEPSIAAGGTGVYTIVYPSTVTAPNGEEVSLRFRGAIVCPGYVNSYGATFAAHYIYPASAQALFRFFTGSFVAVTPQRFTWALW